MTTIAYELRRRRLPPPSRRALARAGALGATVVFAVLFVRAGSLGAAVRVGAGLSLWTLAVALASVGGAMWLTAVRWRILLRGAGVDAPSGRLFAALAVGAAANNLLPARGGDVVRVAAVRETAPVSAVVGTMAAERLLDGFTLALWLLAGALAVDGAGPLAAIGLALALGVGAGLALASRLSPAGVERLAGRLPERVRPRVVGAGTGFLGGLAGLRSPALLVRALAASFALWLCDVAMYGALAHGLGLPVGVGGWFLLEGIGNLALAVPATAAGIGSFDYLTLLGARAVGVGGPTASAYVLAVHALVVLPATIVGLLLARRAFRRPSAPDTAGGQAPGRVSGGHVRAGSRRQPRSVRVSSRKPTARRNATASSCSSHA